MNSRHLVLRCGTIIILVLMSASSSQSARQQYTVVTVGWLAEGPSFACENISFKWRPLRVGQLKVVALGVLTLRQVASKPQLARELLPSASDWP